MPISKYYKGHGDEVMANMKKEYGDKKGEQVFYATANKKGETANESINAKCPVCGKTFSELTNGAIPKHGTIEPNKSGAMRDSKPCSGSGQKVTSESVQFVSAVRGGDYHGATQIFNTLMREKLEAALGKERATTKINEDYNGWKNRQTWNVALWIGNDQGLYNMARDYARSENPYEDFAAGLKEIGGKIAHQTPDGVAWNDSGLDIDALDDMMRELVSESVVNEGDGKDFPINLDPSDDEKKDVKDRLLKQGKYAKKDLKESACPSCGKPFVGVYRDAGSDEQRDELRCKSCGSTAGAKK